MCVATQAIHSLAGQWEAAGRKFGWSVDSSAPGTKWTVWSWPQLRWPASPAQVG
jgi:hypothetical protein